MALKSLGVVTVNGEKVSLSQATYQDGVSIAIVADTANGEAYGKLSVFVRGLALEPGCFVVKDYSENKALAAAALASGLFIDTGRRVQVSDWVKAPIWRIKG
jgi:hypothetical protein